MINMCFACIVYIEKLSSKQEMLQATLGPWGVSGNFVSPMPMLLPDLGSISNASIYKKRVPSMIYSPRPTVPPVAITLLISLAKIVITTGRDHGPASWIKNKHLNYKIHKTTVGRQWSPWPRVKTYFVSLNFEKWGGTDGRTVKYEYSDHTVCFWPSGSITSILYFNAFLEVIFTRKVSSMIPLARPTVPQVVVIIFMRLVFFQFFEKWGRMYGRRNRNICENNDHYRPGL